MNVQAQKVESQKISFGLVLSPTINYRSLTSDAANDFVKDQRDESETVGFRYQGGLTIDFRPSEKLEIQSGVIFADRLFRTKSIELVWPSGVPEFSEAYVSQRYLSVDVPLRLRYTLLARNKFNYYVAGGVTAAFFVARQQRNHVLSSGSWEVTQSPLLNESTWMLLGEMEAGLDYALSTRLKLRAALNFQHGLTPTNPDYPTKEYLYSGGIRFGLVFTPTKRSKSD